MEVCGPPEVVIGEAAPPPEAVWRLVLVLPRGPARAQVGQTRHAPRLPLGGAPAVGAVVAVVAELGVAVAPPEDGGLGLGVLRLRALVLPTVRQAQLQHLPRDAGH